MNEQQQAIIKADAKIRDAKSRAIITMWETGKTCPKCHAMVYTDGKVLWCSRKCKNHDQPTSEN